MSAVISRIIVADIDIRKLKEGRVIERVASRTDRRGVTLTFEPPLSVLSSWTWSIFNSACLFYKFVLELFKLGLGIIAFGSKVELDFRLCS